MVQFLTSQSDMSDKQETTTETNTTLNQLDSNKN